MFLLVVMCTKCLVYPCEWNLINTSTKDEHRVIHRVSDDFNDKPHFHRKCGLRLYAEGLQNVALVVTNLTEVKKKFLNLFSQDQGPKLNEQPSYTS